MEVSRTTCLPRHDLVVTVEYSSKSDGALCLLRAPPGASMSLERTLSAATPQKG